MKLNNWIKFNESVKDTFTEEMAQEIMYYFSEDSSPSKELVKIFDIWLSELDIEDNFVMYETSYAEMKEMIKKLYGFVQTESLDFKDSMIQLYHKIREERKDFPEACEIEDTFLNLIENNDFNFMIYSTTSRYEIRLQSNVNNRYKLEDYINFCKLVNNSVSKIHRSKLIECKFYDSRASFCDFIIEIKS
jgi:hypothetical protein